MVKKFLYLAMILIIVLVAPTFSFAAGVPVFQYNQAVTWEALGVPVNFTTNYDSRTFPVYYPEWGTYSDYYATRCIYFSPSYVGTDFYISSLTVQSMGIGSAKHDLGRSMTIQGFDGYNWIHLWSNGFSTTGQSLNNYQVSPVKQIRVIANISYRNEASCDGQGYFRATQIGISILGSDQDSVNQARDAANIAATNATNAYNAANTAATNAASANVNASNAYNSVSNVNGNTITAVRDASGTALSEARQAKTNAANASTNASQANTNALNAYNTTQAVNTKIDSLSTAVTNIQNNLGADTSPPSVKIETVSGALATSGNNIRAVVNASDNVSTTFTYSLDGTAYQALPADGVISLPVNLPGSNLIAVWVKDVAGNIGRSSIIVRKL
ncbi:MAG: hypothetical protein ACYDEQ_11605 [Desulfocucumaceae bacterium]